MKSPQPFALDTHIKHPSLAVCRVVNTGTVLLEECRPPNWDTNPKDFLFEIQICVLNGMHTNFVAKHLLVTADTKKFNKPAKTPWKGNGSPWNFPTGSAYKSHSISGPRCPSSSLLWLHTLAPARICMVSKRVCTQHGTWCWKQLLWHLLKLDLLQKGWQILCSPQKHIPKWMKVLQ